MFVRHTSWATANSAVVISCNRAHTFIEKALNHQKAKVGNMIAKGILGGMPEIRSIP